MKSIQTLLLVSPLLLALACDSAAADEGDSGTEGESDTSDMPTFDEHVLPLIEAKCSVEGCHDAVTVETINLESDVAYDNLVNQPSSVLGYPLILPGDHEGSYLWLKVNNEFAQVGGLGNQMPIGGTLSGQEKDLLKTWIDQGAER